eukprot:SAG11_NODE_5380_length_1578_cov_1.574713_2_plen_221_part_00
MLRRFEARRAENGEPSPVSGGTGRHRRGWLLRDGGRRRRRGRAAREGCALCGRRGAHRHQRGGPVRAVRVPPYRGAVGGRRAALAGGGAELMDRGGIACLGRLPDLLRDARRGAHTWFGLTPCRYALGVGAARPVTARLSVPRGLRRASSSRSRAAKVAGAGRRRLAHGGGDWRAEALMRRFNACCGETTCDPISAAHCTESSTRSQYLYILCTSVVLVW